MSQDEVDGVIQAWRRERPDLGVDSMAIWSRLNRLAGVLEGHRRECFAQSGLETWEFDVLAALRRAGEPYQLSPGQLIQQTRVTSGTMTNRIERLRSRGLVTRQTDPSDGRAAVVTLTQAGRQAVDSALTTLLAREAELLAGWSQQDQTQLADLLRRLALG